MKKQKKHCYIIVFFWIVFFQNAVAQSPYIFHHLNTNDGLSNTNVKSILRDKYGFLWIGTNSGLNRYDGYGFKVYTMQPGKPNTLDSNNIVDLQEDGLGNVWVNLGYTYMVYNRGKDNFISNIKQFLQKLGIQSDDGRKIYVDKKQNLWIINKEKISCYNIESKKALAYHLKVPLGFAPALVSISDDEESLFFIDPSGKCWRFNFDSGIQSIIKSPNFNNQNKDAYPNKIYVDSNKGLWIYLSKPHELFYKENQSQEWKFIELKSELKTVSNTVTSIIEGGVGQILIGTDHKGLFIYDKTKELLTNIVHHPYDNRSLSFNNIDCLYRDNNETIWIGHIKKGLSFYHESFRNFMNFEHTECTDISTIMEDHLGNIWLGTDGNGLFVKEKKSNNILTKLPIPNTAIVCLLEDKKKRVWVGTYQKGLFCYENGKIVQYTIENSKLSNNDIWSLKEDRYGNIWIGTLGGKIHLLPLEANNFDSLLSPFDENIHALDMFYDGGDKIFIATVNGISVVDITNNKKVTYYGNKKGNQQFTQNKFLNVYVDKHDILWLGHSGGLDVWDQKKDTIYNFNKSKGLCDNSVSGIIGDNLNNIWVTTSNGFSILTVERTSNENLNIESKNYSVKDGLMDNFFNNHSISKLRSGDMILGNKNGYTVINPNKLAEKNRPMAKVMFTGLTIGNQNIQVDSVYNGHKVLEHPMEMTSNLRFQHNDRFISLQFTTGDLLNAHKVRYLYKIEGFNTQWVPTQENKIIISVLPFGDYRLLVKASNSDGVWSDEPAILNIEVMPPFYFSAWAMAAYALTFISALVYFIRRSKKLHLVKLEQQRIKMDREKETHISEMKLRFFTNISHDLRTPLTLIILPLQTLLNDTLDANVKKKLNTIYKNANQLLSLINSLLDFRKLDVGIDTLNLKSGDFVSLIKDVYSAFSIYAEERNIDLSFTSNLESLPMQFDKDKIQKTLINLLSNALKHTPDEGVVNIHISKDEDYVCVSVSDSGSGINDEDKEYVFDRFYQAKQKQDKIGSGLGLHISKEYVNIHGGTISLKDNEPQGCIFTFKIPIRRIDEINDLQSVEIIDEEIIDELDELDSATTKPVLLFVDDNKDFCEFIEDNLKEVYSIITANDGQEALNQLHKYDVTIIVSDVMMPVMSGTELCKQVKTNIRWSHIPVILLTARTAEEYQLEGLELGADDYITKPFNFDLLRLRIRKFIEWSERSHNTFSQKLDVSPAEITITPLDRQLIEKAIKIVEDNIGDTEFSVVLLGESLGLSRGHLYKKLKFITGKGPAEFIRVIRLKRGRQLLEKSQLQISEIAYEVGFNSPKRFAKYFREEFGVSPSEYLHIQNGKKVDD